MYAWHDTVFLLHCILCHHEVKWIKMSNWVCYMFKFQTRSLWSCRITAVSWGLIIFTSIIHSKMDSIKTLTEVCRKTTRQSINDSPDVSKRKCKTAGDFMLQFIFPCQTNLLFTWSMLLPVSHLGMQITIISYLQIHLLNNRYIIWSNKPKAKYITEICKSGTWNFFHFCLTNKLN